MFGSGDVVGYGSEGWGDNKFLPFLSGYFSTLVSALLVGLLTHFSFRDQNVSPDETFGIL